MLKDRATSRDRLSVPFAYRLYRWKVKLCFFLIGNAIMAIENRLYFSHESDETFEEDRKPSWPFATENEEHLYFDNLQRVADIRSAQ